VKLSGLWTVDGAKPLPGLSQRMRTRSSALSIQSKRERLKGATDIWKEGLRRGSDRFGAGATDLSELSMAGFCDRCGKLLVFLLVVRPPGMD
jgi:hypothetical protein